MNRKRLIRSIICIAALVSLFVAQPTSAADLAKLLVLDVSGDQVIEKFRADEFGSEEQNRILPESLWQARIETELGDEGQNLSVNIVYSAISASSDGTLEKISGPF